MATIPFEGQEERQFSSLYIDSIYTDLTTTNYLFRSYMYLDPSADSSIVQRGFSLILHISDDNVQNVDTLDGMYVEVNPLGDGNYITLTASKQFVDHEGPGTITTAIGGWHKVSNAGGGTITTAKAATHTLTNTAGTITDAYASYVAAPTNSGTITTFRAFYAEELIGATNLSYLWFNSDGVLDIREASSQAILGLHNPGITKFTSGSANYERSVLQWASNILQLGAETGGTGTLRKVRLLGAGLILDTDILPSSDPGVPGQVYRTAGALMVSL